MMKKKQPLPSPPRHKNSGESGAVADSGKSEKDSPLKDYQFKPGESGNLKGRPPTSDLKAEVRAFADEQDPKLRKSRLRQWLEMADRRARQGSPKHLEMLLAYGWGRPPQALEHSGTLNLAEILDKARRRAESAALPALPTSTDGHCEAQAGQDAGAAQDGAERPAIEHGPIKRIVVN
jgi:hypothetical protein